MMVAPTFRAGKHPAGSQRGEHPWALALAVHKTLHDMHDIMHSDRWVSQWLSILKHIISPAR